MKVILLSLYCAIVYATRNVDHCGSNVPFPNAVNVAGCDASPCSLHRGTIGTTFINMTIPRNTTSFEPKISAQVSIFVVGYDMPESLRNGCEWIESNSTRNECPLQAGDVIIYRLEQQVEESVPSFFSPELIFNILDDQGLVIVCFKWTANIK